MPVDSSESRVESQSDLRPEILTVLRSAAKIVKDSRRELLKARTHLYACQEQELSDSLNRCCYELDRIGRSIPAGK